MGKRTRVVWWIVVAGTTGLTAACASGTAHDSSSAPGGAEVAQDAAVPAGGAAGPSEASASFAIDAASAPPAAVGRQVVSTATVGVRVDDIAAARQVAAAATEAAGGYVHSEQGQFGASPSATMTLKVPPDRFRPLLATLGDLGEVDRQDVATDDVTEQVIDLDSRIASAEVSVARVRGFLDRATNVLEISSFESELLRRETDLEKLRGQKRALDGRVDLATIVLTVQPSPAVAAPDEPTDLPAFGDGLAAGWSAFVGLGRITLAVFGAVLPFAPVLFVGGVLVWWSRRRNRPAPV